MEAATEPEVAAELGGPLVESLEVGAFEVPTDQPESDGTLEWSSTTIIVVEVAGGGAVGLGYTYCEVAAAQLIASTLADAVRGADALAPPQAWALMQRAVRNAGRKGLCAMAISAVDIALWDLRAKLLGLSLAESLGRFHDSVPIYGSGGFTSYSDRELERQLAGWVEDGIGRVKIKVGREPERDPQRLRRAREAIGPETRLMVDANGAFTRKQALSWAERYAESGVSYFEEPVSSDDPEGLRILRDCAPAGMEIAAGEYASDLPELELLAGCVDVLQADVTRCGGITNLRRADGICRGRQLPFSAHCAPLVSAHVCAAIETVAHIEYFHDHVRLEAMLFDGVPSPRGGELRPEPGRPGLGVEFKREDADRYRA
jgi:L-alanine-DL-glutamate epimerase-like enolase superfamily enzyme